MSETNETQAALAPTCLKGVLFRSLQPFGVLHVHIQRDHSVYDREYHPAAGELSKVQGWVLCCLLAGGGLAIVTTKFGSLITKLYSFGLFLGTIYSVPPLRLKRFAVAAFMIIATVRGFLLNFGVYHAVRAALGLPFVWSPVIT